jgi:hypothetical protein
VVEVNRVDRDVRDERRLLLVLERRGYWEANAER